MTRRKTFRHRGKASSTNDRASKDKDAALCLVPFTLALMNRRTFLTHTTAALTGAAFLPNLLAAGKHRPRILLRSSWQTVNIGDIAHTPGVLALLEKYIPEAEVRLWPSSVGDGVEEMLRKRFPKLAILEREDFEAAFAECDFFLHGSGPSLVASKDLARWRKETGKPYGIYGITLGGVDVDLRPLLNDAKFVFCRDTVSLQTVKDAGVTCPIIEFGPDGAFGVDLRNDEAAAAFLKANNLTEGQYLCCIPRLRNTPYWKIKKGVEFSESKHKRNEEMKEHDHAALRQAIIAVTRETPLKVLVCPEDASRWRSARRCSWTRSPTR